MEALTGFGFCHVQIQKWGTMGCFEWIVKPRPEPLLERERNGVDEEEESVRGIRRR